MSRLVLDLSWTVAACGLVFAGCRAQGPASSEPEIETSSASPVHAAMPERAEAPRTSRGARVLESIVQDGQEPTVRVVIDHPRYAPGQGPRLGLDHGHHDFHTLDGMFAPFGEAAQQDGFTVVAHEGPFTEPSLASLDILVIANALHERNDHRLGGQWTLPTPSAFTDEEIAIVDAWVQAGGRLWLIADHMPFPGGAEGLAARLGFRLDNGFAFAVDEHGEVVPDTIEHSREQGTVVGGHPIVDGHDQSDRISVVHSFTGQAFEVPDDATVLLRMPTPSVSLRPATAWQFDEHTPRQDVSGWAVMAARAHGRGRVVMSGEAAMLSARYVQDEQGRWQAVGFHAPQARDNLRLVLATLEWLAE